MKYKTVIEITSEAPCQSEALDIAGEFLKGNLEQGISMRCKSVPVLPRKLLKASILLLVLLGLSTIAGLLAGNTKEEASFPAIARRLSAIQPPLKTSSITGFKDDWRQKESREALKKVR